MILTKEQHNQLSESDQKANIRYIENRIEFLTDYAENTLPEKINNAFTDKNKRVYKRYIREAKAEIKELKQGLKRIK